MTFYLKVMLVWFKREYMYVCFENHSMYGGLRGYLTRELFYANAFGKSS